jgi:outer membrane protein assembly factor BamB
VDAAPVVSDEGVYAASWSGQLSRVGLLDGSVLARAQLPDAADAAPVLRPGLLALQSWDRSIRLFRRGDLSPLDSFREESSPADDHRQSSPVLEGTRLFVATWAGRVRAFDSSNGALVPGWEFRAEGPFRADLSLDNSRLFAPCQDGRLYALDAASGRLLWSLDAGAPLLSGAASDGQTVYLADRSGRLRAVDAASGKERWGADLGAAAWYAPPLLLADGLFQGDDAGRLSRFDPATGRLLGRGVWAPGSGAGPRSSPTTASRWGQRAEGSTSWTRPRDGSGTAFP